MAETNKKLDKERLLKRLYYFEEEIGKYREQGLKIKISNMKTSIKNKIVTYDLVVSDAETGSKIKSKCQAGLHIMNTAIEGKV